MFGIKNRYLRPWMKVGTHCEVRGEGGGNIFTIGQLDMNTGCAAMMKGKRFHGWEGWEKLYRTAKCRKLDREVLTS